MNKPGLATNRPTKNKKDQAIKTRHEDKGPMVRGNFELTEADHTNLKIFAARERRSISEVLRELISKNIPAQN